MPAHDDVLHLEVRDGVGDDAAAVEVRRGQDVGDVAVHEDIAGLEAEDGGLGDAGVGAADPEDLGLLARGEGGEEVRLVVGCCLGPLFVLLQGELESICEGANSVLLAVFVWGIEEGAELRVVLFGAEAVGWENDRAGGWVRSEERMVAGSL